ncbi:MAG: DUF1349 domain-containing protein [Bacteroidota bacterium]
MHQPLSTFRITLLLFVLCLTSQTEIRAQASTVRITSIPHVLNSENNPVKVTADGNTLTITAGPRTDMFRDPNVTYNTDNAAKVMFNPADDFILSCAIEHDFTAKWDGGAIILVGDDRNWVKFCFEMDYKLTHRVVSVVTKDISDDANSIGLKAGKTFFKMAKAGNVITLYQSDDGKDWYLIRHLQFDLKPGFRAGFLAQSPTGEKCTVRFSDIRYEARRIADPYTGN